MVNKKYLIIYIILAIIPIIVLGIFYPSLPEMVAVRNNGMNPSDFENKSSLFLLPIFNIIMAILGIFIPKLDKLKVLNIQQRISEKIFVVVLVLFNLIFYTEILMAMGKLSLMTFGIMVVFTILTPFIFSTILGLIVSNEYKD